ncbi:MAG: histidine kinase [Bacteroidetes bacterium]|nr:histidine kinase [Bacteroidota bacterium]
MARINWIRIGYHLLFWLVYLFLNGLVVCVMEGHKINSFVFSAMYREAYSLPVKLAFTYFIFYYVLPLYLDRRKLGNLILMSVVSFAIATLLYRVQLWWYFTTIEPRPYSFFGPQGVILCVFDLYITITSAVIIKMIKLRYKSQEVEERLINEKLQSELSFLRAQTNPHFLFNTLNNLFVLARKKSDKTADAIMMLSKIMRFVLYECRAPRIAVSDEAKVIRDYIELEKLRYNQRLTVDYQEVVDNPHASISPLLLLPFVENSFKHGAAATTGDVSISIHLTLENNQLQFLVSNTVDEEYEPPTNGTGGIGLKNVKRQLDLLYPEQYALNIGRENGFYKANLKVDLSEN